MPQAERIAVLLPNWVGDVVMATPALRALRRCFAGSEIVHVGRPVALELLAGGDLADGQMTDLSHGRSMPINLLRQAGRMRKRRFDLAVLLPNSFRSALLCWLGRVGRIAGYDRDGRGWMLSDKLAPPRDSDGRLLPVSAIDYYNALARMLGAEADSRRMFLPSGRADADGLIARVTGGDDRPTVMLNPGASFGPSKVWPAERYAAVADALIERHGARIVINAAPSERRVAATVAKAMRHRPTINLAEHDNTISLLKSLMRLCCLLITNDTGARHMAAAIGIGVVTVFGSTDPAWSRIDYPLERTVRVDVPCGPCQKKRCPLPVGKMRLRCLTAITPEMVLAAAEELLAVPAAGKERRA